MTEDDAELGFAAVVPLLLLLELHSLPLLLEALDVGSMAHATHKAVRRAKKRERETQKKRRKRERERLQSRASSSRRLVSRSRTAVRTGGSLRTDARREGMAVSRWPERKRKSERSREGEGGSARCDATGMPTSDCVSVSVCM